MIKPILLFGYGNLSRGDDALGPLLLDYIERNLELDQIDILCDFQLQVEHALDLQGRERALFVDAAVNQDDPIVFTRLRPERDRSYSSHAMSPSAVLEVYSNITRETPPPAFLLSIAGSDFALGEELSITGRTNLVEACRFSVELLRQPVPLDGWIRMARYGPFHNE